MRKNNYLFEIFEIKRKKDFQIKLMSSIIKEIEYDERDAKFIKIKEKFIQAIKKNFECEEGGYDEVIKYVFEEVFKNKMQKETCLEEFKQIFEERTEEYVELLFKLANQILREDYKDNDEPSNDNLDNDKQKKYSKRNEGNYQNYGNRENYRKGSRDYYQGGREKDRNFRGGNRKGNFGRGGSRFKVGNKEVIIHNNNQRKRSRSRENSEGENAENPGRFSSKTYMEDYQEYPNQGFQGRGFYNQPQPRMFPQPMMRGVPYFPGMMGYMGMQR